MVSNHSNTSSKIRIFYLTTISILNENIVIFQLKEIKMPTKCVSPGSSSSAIFLHDPSFSSEAIIGNWSA